MIPRRTVSVVGTLIGVLSFLWFGYQMAASNNPNWLLLLGVPIAFISIIFDGVAESPKRKVSPEHEIGAPLQPLGGEKSRDPLDTNCRKCNKPLGPGGRRGMAIMKGSDFMSLIAERAVYACQSCGTPFCLDCMSALKANPCPVCKQSLGW